MTDMLTAPSDADTVVDAPRRPATRRTIGTLVAIAALGGAVAVGLTAVGLAAGGTVTRDDAAVAGTGAEMGSDAAAGTAWLDVEFDYLGAVATWPSAPDAPTANPFRAEDDADLLTAGRTVCTRAGDEGMDAAGMGDLLDTTPHQTYVLVTEAIDKLCPSQRTHLAGLRR